MTLVTKRFIGFGALLLTVALIVLAVGLLEHHTDQKADKQDDDAHLVQITRDKVNKLTLENDSGKYVMTRLDGAWWLDEPIDVAADSNVVDSMVSAIAELRRTRKIEVDGHAPDEEDLAIYGLAPPLTTLTIETGTDQQTIELGKKNDFSSDLYARVRGSNEVVMVAGSFDYQVAKSLFDLRDKRLVSFIPDGITRLDVTRPNGSVYVLERRGGRRFFVTAGDLSAEADAPQVSGILSAVVGLRASAFATDSNATTDERKTFLSRPQVRVKISSGDDVHRLVVAKENDAWYAGLEDEESPIIVTSGEALVRKLDVDASSLRDVRVLHFERADVKQVTVTRGGDSVTVKTDDKGAWQLTAASPSDGGSFPREADGARVSGLIYTLFNLQASRIVSEDASPAQVSALGFEKPQLTVTLASSDGKSLATLEAANDSQKRTLAREAGKTRIDQVGAESLADISAKLTNYLPSDAEAPK